MRVELRPDQEIERQAAITIGRALYGEGLRSKETFLVEDMGMSEDEAAEEQDEILVDRAINSNPLLLEFVMREAMKELGMKKLIDEMDAAAKVQGATAASVANQPDEAKPRILDTDQPGNVDRVRQMLSENGRTRAPEGAGGQ